MAMRNPKELAFDTASTLYIGQAGPILKGNFQVTCKIKMIKRFEDSRIFSL